MNDMRNLWSKCSGRMVLLGLFLLPLLIFSCKKSDTYADYMEDEDEKIDSYISRENIAVTGTMPTSSTKWKDGDKDLYYLYGSGKSDGLYFHLIDAGSGDIVPETNWTAYVRYTGTTLDGDLVYDCTAARNPDPLSFVVQDDAHGQAYGRGFQQAVRNLRVGGHCKVIIPFAIGNGMLPTISGGLRSDYSNYQPMVYEIWLVGLE